MLRAFLTILAAILFTAGWIVGKIAVVVSWIARTIAHSWMGAAIKVGWMDAHRKRTRKDVT
jgi:hypothetical protein